MTSALESMRDGLIRRMEGSVGACRAEIMDAISETVDARMYKHMGVQLPASARRLVMSVASHTGLAARMAVDSVREQSTRLCEMDDQCRLDMPNTNSVTLPMWAFTLTVAVDGVAVLLAVLVTGLLVVQRCRRESTEKATATTAQESKVCEAI